MAANRMKNIRKKLVIPFVIGSLLFTSIVSYAAPKATEEASTEEISTEEVSTEESTKSSSDSKKTTADSDNTTDSQATDTQNTADSDETQFDDVDYNTAVDDEGALSEVAALEQAIVEKSDGEIYGHKLIADSKTYELYLYEPTLSIILRNKKTGAIMESTVRDDDGKSNATWSGFIQSGIVLDVLDGVNTAPTKVDLVNKKTKIDIDDIEDGFSATVNYPDYEIGYQLNVSLKDDELTVEIPNDSIIEDSDQYKIGNIYVYPFLGYTYLGEREGYMFVPDGNGAVINLDNKEGRFGSSIYSQQVYGDNIGFDSSYVLSLFWDKYETINDSEYALAPVYGMVHTDSKLGYLAIIEEGDYNATIEAYPNGSYTNYNWVTAKFGMRQVYVQPTSKSGGSVTKVEDKRTEYNIKLLYKLVSEDEANYTGLAVNYRDYLLNDYELEPQDNSFKMRLDFLGTERENWLLFKKTIPMTTVDNIREIYNELQGEGVNDILSLYKGWQKGGLYDVPITSYKADKSIGGTSDLTKLIKDSKDMGIDLYLYQDALRINPDTNNTTFNVVKKVDKRLYQEELYAQVYDTMLYLIPSRTNTLLTKLFKQYSKKGIENLAIGGITNSLYSYSYSGKQYTRVDTANAYEDTLSTLSDSFNCVLEEPFAYLWKYSTAMIDMPTSTSDYIFTDENVPFLSIALKGIIPMYADYTNFEANKTEFFLKLVETGIYPSFYLTYEDPSDLLYTNSSDIYTSKYSTYKDEIIDYYNKLKEINDSVKDAYIIGHEYVSDNVVVVTYNNDKKIYINYGKEKTNVDGITIEPESYKVGDAK